MSALRSITTCQIRKKELIQILFKRLLEIGWMEKWHLVLPSIICYHSLRALETIATLTTILGVRTVPILVGLYFFCLTRT